MVGRDSHASEEQKNDQSAKSGGKSQRRQENCRDERAEDSEVSGLETIANQPERQLQNRGREEEESTQHAGLSQAQVESFRQQWLYRRER